MPVLFSEKSLSEATLGLDSDQWLIRFKEYSRDCIMNVYNVQNLILNQSMSGRVTTSLPGDLFSLLDIQIRTLDKYLEENGFLGSRKGICMRMDGLTGVLQAIIDAQVQSKALFLISLQDCCAASNDFAVCAERVEEVAQSIYREFPFLAQADEGTDDYAVKQLLNDLIETYSRDSVQCAEHTHIFMMREIRQSSLASDLFSLQWADDWVQNEVMSEILRIAGRMQSRLSKLLATEYQRHKATSASVRALVCNYIRCLILVAESIERSPKQKLGFRSTKRALLRMRDDISLIDQYAKKVAEENAPLTKSLVKEVQYLELIYECLSSADDLDSLESFIVVIHKRTGTDSLITRHFVGDLWILVAHEKPTQEVNQTMASLDADLAMVSSGMKERRLSVEDGEMSFANLALMLTSMYEDRIAQGALPVCWTCVPKSGTGGELIAGRIRDFTRKMAEKKWKKLAT